jgi:5-methyltetrahydrofolate--homocysteine methyltransferase
MPVPKSEERSAKVRVGSADSARSVSGSEIARRARIDELWSYINPYMLYGRHLGFKGNFEKALGEGDAQGAELLRTAWWKGQAAGGEIPEGESAVWQFFEAERDGNAIICSRRAGRAPIHTFISAAARGERALPERLHSAGAGAVERDHLAIFVVTPGAGMREKSEEMQGARPIISLRMDCRRWRSKRRRGARNGCIAAFARIGAFPIRRR